MALSDLLLNHYRDTRERSVAHCAPLQTEDYGLQAEPFTSPPKWHLAHTTWFFETFILKPFVADYRTPDERYEVLFNSYYQGVGEPFPRPRRGLLSRPCVDEVLAYRSHVDAAMCELLEKGVHTHNEVILERTRLGVEHEQQHQELFFTDIKYSLHINPLLPVYFASALPHEQDVDNLHWLPFEGGLCEIGHPGDDFCFDNELPRHPVYLQPFELANRLVTNAEYATFIADGGYERSDLWLADGWDLIQKEGWRAPLYWMTRDGYELEYTLHGPRARSPSAPVCHVSGYEADAYARWTDARLPTEAEWETVASTMADAAAVGTNEYCHPLPARPGGELQQLFGSCWQWTRSAYEPYPGFSPSPGAIGEYNGKFMSNQWVLRGSSCVSQPGHARASYRNFFYPPDRWQFSGIRLARDIAR